MRASLLPIALVVLALPACAGYGPVDPAGRPAPVRAPAPVSVVPPIESGDGAVREEGGAAVVGHLEGRGLIVPVAGVDPRELRDSFAAGRDRGARQHNAIDIMAPRGTPVLAADSGRIIRLSRTSLGGISLYAVDPSETLVYYYAHLDGYHERLAEGATVARGDTLGYVGSTGNASADAPHLHFQVMRMPGDRRRYWDGEPINPFPVLVQASESQRNEVRQAGDEARSQSEAPRQQR